jgi:hypothetical protein
MKGVGVEQCGKSGSGKDGHHFAGSGSASRPIRIGINSKQMIKVDIDKQYFFSMLSKIMKIVTPLTLMRKIKH